MSNAPTEPVSRSNCPVLHYFFLLYFVIFASKLRPTINSPLFYKSNHVIFSYSKPQCLLVLILIFTLCFAPGKIGLQLCHPRHRIWWGAKQNLILTTDPWRRKGIFFSVDMERKCRHLSNSRVVVRIQNTTINLWMQEIVLMLSDGRVSFENCWIEFTDLHLASEPNHTETVLEHKSLVEHFYL